MKINDRVIDIFLCKQKQLYKAKNGKNYLYLILQDKTGNIVAKIWEVDTNPEIKDFLVGDFVKIDGLVNLYGEELQINVSRLRRAEPEEYDLKNYIKSADNIDKLKDKLNEFILSVKNIFLSSLLKSIFANQDIYQKFCVHSAGKSMHHNYFSGLLEHTVSVTEICDFMIKRNKLLNHDILITSALLHDIGKIYELSNFPENDYTYDGELLGHIIIGADLISKKILEINNFPNDLRAQVIHCILAHHGEYEFGSPKLPKSIEAIVLHFADNLDAKTNMFEQICEADNNPDSKLTDYDRRLGMRLLKPDKNNDA